MGKELPAIHGPDHLPGGPDPITGLFDHIVKFDVDLQEDDFLYASATGQISLGDPYGIHFLADYGIQLENKGAHQSAFTLFDDGTDGIAFVDCGKALFNCAVDFEIRDTGALHSLFRVDADGTIHGKASVGAITWDL